MTVKQYEIVLVGLDPVIGSEMAKTRPAVVVSADEMNDALDTVVICPLTTKLHPGWRSRIQISTGGRRAEIAIDQIRAISKRRVIKRLDRVGTKTVTELRRAISEMYGDG